MHAALAQDFENHGAAAIEAPRERPPERYVQVVASLFPKNIGVRIDATDEVLSLAEHVALRQQRLG